MAEVDSAAASLLGIHEESDNKENEETADFVDSLLGDSIGKSIEQHNGLETEEECNIPLIDIYINNVVCTFNTRCHLDLRKIAMEGKHVEYKRQNGMCNMKIRHPYSTASVWSSGKITCTGATSEEESKIAARKFARQLQLLGFKVKFTSFRVVNVLGTCILPFKVKITNFSRKHTEASYEPELHPGVTYKIKDPKATLKIFSTGSITVTAPCVDNVQHAISYIYPLVEEFKADEEELDPEIIQREAQFIQRQQERRVKPVTPKINYDDVDYDAESESEDEEFDSDESQD